MRNFITILVTVLFVTQTWAARGLLEMKEAIQQQHGIALGFMVEMSDSTSIPFGGSDAYIDKYTRFDAQTDQCFQRTVKNISGNSDIEIVIDGSHCTHLKNPLGFFQGRNFEPKTLNLVGAVFDSATLLVQKRQTGERICAITWGISTSIRIAKVFYSVDSELCK